MGNYVLINYENVQSVSTEVLNSEHFRVHMFVGASKKKVHFEEASTLQLRCERGECTVSKDTGSDPLIQHLKERKILTGQVNDVASIRLIMKANAKAADNKLEVIMADLRRRLTQTYAEIELEGFLLCASPI